jgi:hypothetical protein|tara:strand:- start:2230 stop:2535 length:306 start_codon:yes stop_codon:yes gene_type:complete
MKFVISTQYLENYGAHCEDGKFSNGNAYWKFKNGTDYIVSGLTRIQDAVAFVMAKFGDNDLYGKEFPIKFQTFEQWEDELEAMDDSEYRDFIAGQAKEVSP